MSMRTRSTTETIVLCVFAALLFGGGYFVAQWQSSRRSIDERSAALARAKTDAAKARALLKADADAVSRAPPQAPQLAETEMKKAVVLLEQNPDAWRAAYLNKRYRVVGKISSIVGTTQSEPDTTMLPYDGPVFRIELQSWDLPSSTIPWAVLNPKLSFIDLPQPVSLAMRPGQEVDANCTLTNKMLTFAYCRLNKTPGK